MVTGALQIIFLFAALIAFTGYVVFDYELTFRGFALIWCFIYLLLITGVLRKQVAENPETKQRAILNWSFAVFVGTTLTFVFMSFIL